MKLSDRIVLRPATPADEDLLLEWANDPLTRAAGFRPRPITGDEHRRWFADRLRSTTGRILIGVVEGAAVGQIRLDRLPDGRIEIGIAVAPAMRRRGLGRALVRLAMDHGRRDAELRASGFVARIRPDNAASIAIFSDAGFRLARESTVRGYRCLVYEADL